MSLSRGASLLVDKLTLEDEGWFECRILLLDRTSDEFQNGTWNFLSISGGIRNGLSRFFYLDVHNGFACQNYYKL